MLQIGNAGLSPDEAQSHFSAWAVVAAPLLISADLVSGLDAGSLAILSAPEVIGVDQDALGVQGVLVSPAAPQGQECWARPLADGGVAVLLLNRASTTAAVTCTWAQVGLPHANAPATVRDLVARKDLGSFTRAFTTPPLATHASMLVKLTQSAADVQRAVSLPLLKILALGDSITFGCGSDAAPPNWYACCTAESGGYRAPLWAALNGSAINASVLMVGTKSSGPSWVPMEQRAHEGS